MRTISHLFRRSLVITAACLLSLTAPVGVAAAEPTSAGSSTAALRVGRTYEFLEPGVRIRREPSFNSTVLGLGYPGQTFCVFQIGGHWLYGKNLNTGVEGWSHYSVVAPDGTGCAET
jgi:hypothetical protein